MLKTYYFWNNEIFTSAEELKDAIIDFVCDYKNGRIMAMMDEVGCDWDNAHDCEICRANAIEDLVAETMLRDVKVYEETAKDAMMTDEDIVREFYACLYGMD